MKKIILGSLVAVTILFPLHGRGGDAVVGALGGLAVGTMIGHAAADSSGRRTTRAEDEVRRVEDRQTMRREQDQERIARLERELESSKMKTKVRNAKKKEADSIMMILIILIGLLMVAVAGLGFAVLRRRP